MKITGKRGELRARHIIQSEQEGENARDGARTEQIQRHRWERA